MIKRCIMLVVSLFCLLAVTHAPVYGAPLFDDVCTGGNGKENSTICRNRTTFNNPVSGPEGVLLKVTNLVSLITGIAAVIAIAVGGIRFMTSHGDPSTINIAKNTVLYALIGLVVTLVARSLVLFLVNRT